MSNNGGIQKKVFSSLVWAFLERCGSQGVGLVINIVLARLLLPEDTPLLLDDALVMFDDDRLRLALRLLQREAANRQILLFTCQHREQKALTTDL